MQKFYIYILLCADNCFYVGQTDNLEKRIQEHNTSFYNGYTSTKLPVRLVFHQVFPTRSLALEFEKKIKKWSTVKKQALIDGKFSLI